MRALESRLLRKLKCVPGAIDKIAQADRLRKTQFKIEGATYSLRVSSK